MLLTHAPSPAPSTATPAGATPSATSNPTKTTASPNPSPTASLDIPAAAREKSIKGGTEFAKWFANKSSESYVTLDTTWLSAAATPACGACTTWAKEVAEMKAKGHRLSMSRWAFIASQVTQPATLPTFDVDLVGTDRAATVIVADGTVVERTEDAKSWLRFTVSWINERWMITGAWAVDPNG